MNWINLSISGVLLALFIFLAIQHPPTSSPGLWMGVPKAWVPPPLPPPAWYEQPAWWGVILAGINMFLGVLWKILGK